jgi:glycosyltransferase involved in cell wall biosynthesis
VVDVRQTGSGPLGPIRSKGTLDIIEALDAHRRAPELADALFTAQRNGAYSAPIVLSVHTIKDIAGWSPVIQQHPWAATVLVESSHAELLARSGIRDSREMPVLVIPPGVDRERFSQSAEPDPEVLALAKGGEQIVAELGARLVPDKGPDIAVGAFGLVHKILPKTLGLIGQRPNTGKVDEGTRRQDEMRARVRQIAVDAGLTENRNFHLVSYPPERMPGVLRAIQLSGGVLLAPCREETFGMLPLEAFAVGLPVVASDATGHRATMGAAGLPLIPIASEERAPQLFAQTALSLLRGGESRDNLVVAGVELTARYGSDKSALARVDTVYASAIERSPVASRPPHSLGHH